MAALAETKFYRLIKGEAVEAHAAIDLGGICSPDSGQAAAGLLRA